MRLGPLPHRALLGGEIGKDRADGPAGLSPGRHPVLPLEGDRVILAGRAALYSVAELMV